MNLFTMNTARCRCPQMAFKPQPPKLQARLLQGTRQAVVRVVASAKADTILVEAKQKFNANDRMGALKLFEDVLIEPGATARQKQAALFGSTAVHASFGDVDLAQITLREGINQGLDFEQALQDPDLVQMVGSPQIMIQLKRFNQQVQKSIALRGQAPYQPTGGRAKTSMTDIDSIIGSAKGDKAEVDASIPGIIKRVLLVILAGVALGTTLFFLGLEYMFPKY